MRDWAIGLLLVLFLVGCAEEVRRYRQFHDAEAQTIKSSNCIVSLGGILRTYSKEEEAAARVLCRGSYQDFKEFEEFQVKEE